MTATYADKWGIHFHGLEQVNGVVDVPTDHGSDIRLRVTEAVRDRSIVMVTGHPGAGKTFATARAVDAAVDRFRDVHPVWLEMATPVLGKELTLDLLSQISGYAPDRRTPLRELRPIALAEFGAKRRLLIIDEAQHVQPQALRLLRWWHQRAESSFAMVIVGTPDLESKIPDDLSSRIMSDIRVDLIADDDAPELLKQYHPHFATADPALLQRLNSFEGRGEFRWWSKFLLRGDRYIAAAGGVLTAEVAEAICFELRRGGRR